MARRCPTTRAGGGRNTNAISATATFTRFRAVRPSVGNDETTTRRYDGAFGATPRRTKNTKDTKENPGITSTEFAVLAASPLSRRTVYIKHSLFRRARSKDRGRLSLWAWCALCAFVPAPKAPSCRRLVAPSFKREAQPWT
jgi:hypothetical protein